MTIQSLLDFGAVSAPLVATLAVIGTVLWFLIGMRVAPVQRDMSHLGKRVDNLSGDVSSLRVDVSDLRVEVSDLRGDMNAKFSELNGKFDILLTLLRDKPEIESLAKGGSSTIPASATKEPTE